jgi:hypothetical protein
MAEIFTTEIAEILKKKIFSGGKLRFFEIAYWHIIYSEFYTKKIS